MFLIAPFHFSEVASSDPPPAILGLDEDYNTTTYLENGVVWARKGKKNMAIIGRKTNGVLDVYSYQFEQRDYFFSFLTALSSLQT